MLRSLSDFLGNNESISSAKEDKEGVDGVVELEGSEEDNEKRFDSNRSSTKYRRSFVTPIKLYIWGAQLVYGSYSM